jgi:hypothetical protein
MRRFAHDDDESSDDGKAGRLVDRWGVPGLAVWVPETLSWLVRLRFGTR